MAISLNRYVGQFAPSGVSQVDAPSFSIAVQQMIADNNGVEPIQVNLKETNIKAVLEVPSYVVTTEVDSINGNIPGVIYPATNTVTAGSELIFTAIANTGYEFDLFLDSSGRVLGFDPVLKLNISSDTTVIARFTLADPILGSPEVSIYANTENPVSLGSEVILTVEAFLSENDTSTLSYQWYISDDLLDEFKAIPGATSETLLCDTDEVGSKYYYCIVTSSAGPQYFTNSHVYNVVVNE
jgi:hypothetical protein